MDIATGTLNPELLPQVILRAFAHAIGLVYRGTVMRQRVALVMPPF